MQVNQANANVVLAILNALAEPRFSMRSVRAIKKSAEGISAAQVLDTAAQMGLPARSRSSDNKLFIQRPVTVAEVQELATKTAAVIAGTEQPFEIDYTPRNELGDGEEVDGEGNPDLMAGIERGLPN